MRGEGKRMGRLSLKSKARNMNTYVSLSQIRGTKLNIVGTVGRYRTHNHQPRSDPASLPVIRDYP